MIITDEIIEYVAALAKLELAEDEKEKTRKDLNDILNYMTRMEELDTNGVEPMTHVFPIQNVFREDEVTNAADRDNLLANAPVKKDGCFVVPKTVE